MPDKLDEYKPVLNSGELYDCYDPEMLAFQHELVERINRFNATPDTPEGVRERERILREALGTWGEGLFITPPVYSSWGLRNVHVGKNVYFNFNVCLVDDAEIRIGDNCLIGPGCHLVTAHHPASPALRESKLQYNKPIRLGRNVWLGAGAIVLPGVTIGDHSIVGAGSVVTHDVEERSIVAGHPARLLRKITEKDDRLFDHGKPVPDEILRKYGEIPLCGPDLSLDKTSPK